MLFPSVRIYAGRNYPLTCRRREAHGKPWQVHTVESDLRTGAAKTGDSARGKLQKQDPWRDESTGINWKKYHT